MEPKIISSIDDIDGLQFGDAFVIDNPDLADPIEFSDWLAENEKPLIDAVERHLFGQADGELVGTPITVADFRGTGFGAATIAKAAKQGITTVEQLAELGEKGINELSGISDSEAAKIWARVGELFSVAPTHTPPERIRMFDIGYIMTYWLVWWTTLLLYWQGRLSVDFFVISTLIMAAAAGGCLALLLYERANRARIIDASVAEKVDAIEQRLINALTELDQVRRLYNDRVAELQGLQRRQLDILVVEGPDRALGWDYTNIRNLGYNVTMLHSPTWSTFVEHMDALRRRDATPYHIHFAMHGQQHGIEFSDRIAKPLEISEQTKGVRYAFLASCDSNTTAYSMRLIAGHTLSFWGGVGMDEAAQFVYEYYRAIRDGSTATQALYVAKERAPVDAAEKIVAA